MKQIKKLSLSNVISKLTRNEMRYVMAGSGGGTESCNAYTGCSSGCVERIPIPGGDWKYVCNTCCIA
jgi:hypothetical protein